MTCIMGHWGHFRIELHAFNDQLFKMLWSNIDLHQNQFAYLWPPQSFVKCRVRLGVLYIGKVPSGQQ
jgi:hypothetical protein